MTQLEPTSDQIATTEYTVEPIDGSAVRSHASFAPDVHAICHHSGQYLTLKETHPHLLGLFREHHDFPGFPELDRAFATAAHAASYQHMVWSRHGIAGSCMIGSGVVLLGMVALLQGHQDQVANNIEAMIVNGALISGGITGVVLMIIGIISIVRRFDKYHQAAKKRGERPIIDDFPLLHCDYALQAHEEVRIDFANTNGTTPEVVSEPCTLRVSVRPHMEPSRKDFDRYQTLYQQHQIGQWLTAGTLALENNGMICLTDTAAPHLEYNHRVLLRAPTADVFGQPETHQGDVTLCVPYQINGPRRFVTARGDPATPLTCFVHLANSYQLDVHLHWHDPIDALCTLKACQLCIPETLHASVEHTQFGRFDARRQTIIWRPGGRYDITSKSVLWQDLPFNDTALHQHPPQDRHRWMEDQHEPTTPPRH